MLFNFFYVGESAGTARLLYRDFEVLGGALVSGIVGIVSEVVILLYLMFLGYKSRLRS